MPEKTTLIIVLLVIPVLLILIFLARNPDIFNTLSLPLGGGTVLKVKDTPVRVEIADTSEKRTRGLSGRDTLSPSAGMLFTFDEPDLHGIWMKDMRFPIDILWLDASGVIIDIKQNVSPETYPSVFYPRQKASYVLELSARFTELHSVSLGDRVELPEALKKSP